MYTIKELKLKDNEAAHVVNKETGEYRELKKRPNNIPKGKSLLNYKFTKLNQSVIKKLKSQNIFNMEEIGVITYMASICEYNTNSLKPLSNDSSVRELEDFFGINKNRVKKILDNLFKRGVYLSIKIYENEEKEYWVLNPWISWKGKLQDDSIFTHFKDTFITRVIA